MQAVLLAGGLGTRLRSVINDRPKPMAPVCGKPFLEFLILELKKHGITDLILAVGYKGDMIEAYFGNGEQLGVKVQYSYEKEQLGTAGAIKNAEQYITENEFLVLNADTFYQAIYGDVISLYKKLNSDMVLVLRKVEDVSRYGSVRIDGDKITGFNEKIEERIPGVINGGIYLMKKEILNMIPVQKKCSLENEIIPEMLKQGKCVNGIVNDGYFIDIGVPQDYYQFIQDVEQNIIKF